MLLYHLGIRLYSLAIFIATFFSAKAKKLAEGRKNTWQLLDDFKRLPEKELLWFHCASLGEFEQARPIIERLKSERDIQIALSFFSPSGYEIRKNYQLADVIFYLPSDTIANAQKLVKLLSPNKVFFVKYEIWVNLITAIFEQQIPAFLLSATFRKEHIYFKWYGKLFDETLRKFKVIFTQDDLSTELLKSKQFTNVIKSNDTRYDRVYNTFTTAKPLPLIAAFAQQQLVIILGSSYSQEEQFTHDFMSQAVQPHLKIIVAPHHIDAIRIAQIKTQFARFNPIEYSNATLENISQHQVLIIDNIGLLSSLYGYAHIAFIGGGFGSKGIHNTLEAAAFGMPIVIGPNNHHRFPELEALKNVEVLFTIENQEHLNKLFNRFVTDSNYLNRTKARSQAFIKENIGATDIVLANIG